MPKINAPWVHPNKGWNKTTTDKVQVILSLTSPKGVKSLSRFLCMAKYYRDLLARQIELHAPVTSLIGQCDHNNLTRAKMTKQVLG